MKKNTPFTLLLMFLFLSLNAFSQTTHPFLIVEEDMYPTLRQKTADNTQPFLYIKNAALTRWNLPFNNGDWSTIATILNYNTIAYVLQDSPIDRQDYKNKILSILDTWPNQVPFLDNAGAHKDYVDAASMQFNAIIALDVIYNELSPTELANAEANIALIANYYLNNPAPWLLSHYGVNLLYSIYINNAPEITKWKDLYDEQLFDIYMMEDGSWGQSTGYSNARITGTRISKSQIIDVMEFTGNGSYYSDPTMLKLFEWINTFSVTPFGGFTNFGDNGLTRFFLNNSTNLYYADRYGETIGGMAQWNLGDVGPPSFGLSNFFIYVLTNTTKPTKIMPKSLLREHTGAALWGKNDSRDALQGILYSIKRDDPAIDNYGHSLQNANSIDLVAYGEHVLTNSGVRYTQANGTGFNYPGYAPDGGRWNRASLQNSVTIGSATEHIQDEGNGLIDGLIGGSIEFGTTDSGVALGNGSHHRTLALAHPINGKSNGYFMLFDEVIPTSASDNVNINFQTNSLSGGTTQVVANEEYNTPVDALKQANSDGTEKATILFTSNPTVNIVSSYKGDFQLGSLNTDNLKATYATESDGIVRAATIIFPEDGTHSKPTLSKITNVNYNGAKITHTSDFEDFYLVSNENQSNTYDTNITFRAKTTFYRRDLGETIGYTSTEGVSFIDNTSINYGYTSTNPISIQMDNNSGFINAFENTNVTFYRDGITGVKIDNVLLPLISSSSNQIEVLISEGKHTVELDFSGALSLENIIKESLNLHVFPNPTKEDITLQFSTVRSIEKAKLVINDITGRTVKVVDLGSLNIGKQSRSIELNLSNTGIYFLNLYLDKNVFIKKMVSL